jgi:RNA-binding motif X-linked protein 2
MNDIRATERLNAAELAHGLTGANSWHSQYKDSAYVYVGGLSFDLTEGDIIAVMSQ